MLRAAALLVPLCSCKTHVSSQICSDLMINSRCSDQMVGVDIINVLPDTCVVEARRYVQHYGTPITS
jgi:hypothetical protein